MTDIIFIEGVSCAGKSTTVRILSEKLKNKGYKVNSYLEFDYTNPIDFYCTAYFLQNEYDALCSRYYEDFDTIYENDIAVLNNINEKHRIFDVSYGSWNLAIEEILLLIL